MTLRFPATTDREPRLRGLVRALVRQARRILPDVQYERFELPDLGERELALRIVRAVASPEEGPSPAGSGREGSVGEVVDEVLLRGDPGASVRSHSCFTSPLAVRHLVRRARGCAEGDGEGALRLADLATVAAGRVDGAVWGGAYVWSLRLEARAARVEALLGCGELARAASEASALVANATAEVGARLRGDLLFLAGTVYRRLGEVQEARGLFESARDLYEVLEAPTRLGRALLFLGDADQALGARGAAIEAVRRAAVLLKAERDPRAAFCARHNLAIYLCEAGRMDEARRELEASRGVFGGRPDAMTVVSSRWVEARICEGEGDEEGAGRIYEEVQGGLLAGRSVEAAVAVTADLGGVLVRRERFSEVRAAAARLVMLLREEEVPGEVVAAAEALAGVRGEGRGVYEEGVRRLRRVGAEVGGGVVPPLAVVGRVQ